MADFYSDALFTLHHGDCVAVMAAMDADSIDAIVTDPPYGLEFMGKEWDRLGDVGQTSHAGIPDRDGATVFGRTRVQFSGSSNRKCRKCGKWDWDYPDRKCVCDAPDFPNVAAHQAQLMQDWHARWAAEAYRVAKPGAHLLAFGGTRTVHRLTCALEDAGWEIRDCLVWAYASGFPKSLDVSKAIDKAAGAEREVVGSRHVTNAAQGEGLGHGSLIGGRVEAGEIDVTAPATDDAKRWQGWGTALKPAWEPIVLARKPLRGTVAANVTRYGTGALNIDGTRIPGVPPSVPQPRISRDNYTVGGSDGRNGEMSSAAGRWPPNLLLTDPLFDGGVDGVVGGGAIQGSTPRERPDGYIPVLADGRVYNGGGSGTPYTSPGYGDSGTYSRFFLVPKAARGDREPVLRGQVPRNGTGLHDDDNYRQPGERKANHTAPMPRENSHPTVKPVELMRHLVRLVTPPGGTALDPFLGSGTTAIAANEEGFRCIGIEKEREYCDITLARITHHKIGLAL